MTSFGWKRKQGEKVSLKAASKFEENAKEDEDEAIKKGDVDWLTLVPNKKVIRLEDGAAKSARLKLEGTVLAESERYWEAIKKWDEAIQLTPADETLYEMKAQVLLILCEVFPAVHTAKKTIEMKPTWWIGHQTLGRALLGMGEVKMAVKSFSRAIHLHPIDDELWRDDFMWAVSLYQKKMKMDDAKKEELQTSSVKITEIDESTGDETANWAVTAHDSTRDFSPGTLDTEQSRCKVKYVPGNYVKMRH